MTREVLADRNMRILLAGQTVNMAGNTAMNIVLGIWVKDLTGSSGAAGLVFLLLAATGFLAPVTGLIVDRFPRRPLLAVNDLLAGAVVGLLLVVHNRHEIWLIYLVAGAYGVSGQIYRAARGGLLHSMLPDELLGEANGLFGSLGQGMRIIGPVVGAGIYAAWGGGVVAVADIGTFVISAASYLALREVADLRRRGGGSRGSAPLASTGGGSRGSPPLASTAQEDRLGRRPREFASELAAGVRHVMANQVIRRMVIASTVAFTGAGMIDVAMFSLVDQGLHRPTAWIGVLVSTQGAGSILGGLIVGPVMRRTGEYSVAVVGFLLNGAGLAAASTATLAGAIGGAVVIGIGLPMVLVAELTVVQRRTPSELQGRAISASDAIINTPFAFAIAVGAAVITAVGFRLIYLGVAAGFTGVGLALLPQVRVTRPEREITEPAEPAHAAVVPPAVVPPAEVASP